MIPLQTLSRQAGRQRICGSCHWTLATLRFPPVDQTNALGLPNCQGCSLRPALDAGITNSCLTSLFTLNDSHTLKRLHHKRITMPSPIPDPRSLCLSFPLHHYLLSELLLCARCCNSGLSALFLLLTTIHDRCSHFAAGERLPLRVRQRQEGVARATHKWRQIRPSLEVPLREEESTSGTFHITMLAIRRCKGNILACEGDWSSGLWTAQQPLQKQTSFLQATFQHW